MSLTLRRNLNRKLTSAEADANVEYLLQLIVQLQSGGNTGGGDTGGGDTGGGDTGTPIEVPATVLKQGGALTSINDNPGWFYDDITPFEPSDAGSLIEFLGGDNVNHVIGIVNTAYATGVGNRVQAQIYFKHDNGTGANAINSAPTTNGQWRLVKGVTNGNGQFGNNLSYYGMEGTKLKVVDVNSTLGLDNEGDIITGYSAVKGLSSQKRFLVQGAYYNTYINNSLAFTLTPLDGPPEDILIGMRWAVTRKFPYAITPVSSYTGVIKWAAFGDSNTAGNEKTEGVFNRVFANASTKAYYNEGIGGSTTASWLLKDDGVNSPLTRAVARAKANNVNVVSINLGTNDMDMPQNQYEANYQAIIAYIKAELGNDIKICILQIISPQLATDTNGNIPLKNAFLQTLGSTYHLGPWDVYQFYTANPKYMDDDRHPGFAGRRVTAEAAVKGVSGLF
jgi:hypothetical protein